MKTKSYLTIGLLLLAVGLFTFLPLKANSPPQQSAATVILGYGVTLGQVNGRVVEIGMAVTRVSRSQNAPEIPVGTDLAEAMAYLQENDFEMQIPNQRTEFVFNRKKH